MAQRRRLSSCGCFDAHFEYGLIRSERAIAGLNDDFDPARDGRGDLACALGCVAHEFFGERNASKDDPNG
jgi:hypothetical protein